MNMEEKKCTRRITESSVIDEEQLEELFMNTAKKGRQTTYESSVERNSR